VCGDEQCEEDGDCSGGQVCQGCACVNPPVCESGITIGRPVLSLRSFPFSVRFKGEAAIPQPWSAIDPDANGVRIVVDGVSGPGRFDALVPGGAGWTVNAAGTRWTYSDSSASVAGITRIVIRDRSAKTPGLVSWKVNGLGGPTVLPGANDARSAIVLGGPLECAHLAWNGPDEAPPRCTGDASRLVCR
jgi:hypothetical protein